MNELPLIEAYPKPELRSVLIVSAFFALSFMIYINIGGLGGRLIIIMAVLIAIALILNLINRRKGMPVLRIYENRLEHKFVWQKKYRVYEFSDIANASINFEFPVIEVLKLEFNDGRKPVMIQLTNLNVSVEKIFKIIVERVNS